MQEITYYSTVSNSNGGYDSPQMVTRNFESETLARLDALEDKWNEDFSLYRITIQLDGIVKINSIFLGKIKCYADLKEDEREKLIAKLNERLGEKKLNKKIGTMK